MCQNCKENIMIKVLIIDDSSVSLINHKEILMEIGFDVITAKGGEQGIIAFEKERPQIVISDVRMPDVDGFEVLEEILEITDNVHFCFVSSEKNEQLVRKAISLGAKAYLQKPVRLKSFQSVLRKFLT